MPRFEQMVEAENRVGRQDCASLIAWNLLCWAVAQRLP
jgi:hypothetical protein